MTDDALQSLPLDRITWHKEHNPRVFDNLPKRVSELLQSDPTSWAPILVAPLKNDRYLGIDGFARTTTASRLGVKQLKVRVIPMPKDVRVQAFAQNARHGFNLSIAERKAHANYLHSKYPTLSWAELGKYCGISDHTAKAACSEGGEPGSQSSSTPLRELPADHPSVVYSFLKKLVNKRASWSDPNNAAYSVKGLIGDDAAFIQALGDAALASLKLANALGYQGPTVV